MREPGSDEPTNETGAGAAGPVRRVADLEIEPDPAFGERLRRRIHRRLLAGDLAVLSLSGLAHAFVEYVTALCGLFLPEKKSERE